MLQMQNVLKRIALIEEVYRRGVLTADEAEAKRLEAVNHFRKKEGMPPMSKGQYLFHLKKAKGGE